MVKRTRIDLHERESPGFLRGRLSEASRLPLIHRSSLDAPPPDAPLSTVIWDFAEPLLKLDDEPTLGELQKGLEFAMAIWGAVIIEQQQDDLAPLNALRDLAFRRGPPASYELLDLIDRYRQRKLSCFGGDHRVPLRFELSDVEDEYNLVVASYDLDEGQ